MKNNNMLRLILLIALLPLLCSCNQKRDVSRENGWYYILDNRKDSISDEPIVTVKDFVTLRLDSSEMSGQPFYEIVGRVSKYKLNTWGDATEKAIGKRIGFIYNNEVNLPTGKYAIGERKFLHIKPCIRYKRFVLSYPAGKDGFH